VAKCHQVWYTFMLCISVLLMSACGTTTDSLPTVAVLPSATDTIEPTAIAQQATLPATWTVTPTETTTPSLTATQTPTVTPSMTITDTPTATFTPSASPTQIPRPIVDLIELAYNATILPDDYEVPFREGIEVTLGPDAGLDPDASTPTPNINDAGVRVITTADKGQGQFDTAVNCPFYPVGGFATAYTSDPLTAQLLGCPAGNPPDTLQIQSAYQAFERGVMLWIAGSPNRIYALYNNGTYQRFTDTFVDGVDSESGGEVPPEGLQEPTRGFGKVWRNYNAVKGNLGWALSTEIADTATQQLFTRGMMLYIPARGDVLALMENPDGGTGTWKSLAGSF